MLLNYFNLIEWELWHKIKFLFAKYIVYYNFGPLILIRQKSRGNQINQLFIAVYLKIDVNNWKRQERIKRIT